MAENYINDPHEILIKFRDNLESLSQTLPLIMSMLHVVRDKAGTNFNAWLKDNGESYINDNGETVSKIGPELKRRTQKLKRKLELSHTAYELLPRNILISFVCTYDTFLAELTKAFIKLKPETLNSSQKQILFSDLEKFSSIDEAKDSLIDKEIEMALRNGHADQIKWIEKIFNITIQQNIPCWSNFIEATERRNLFVHTDGIVNQQYLTVCKSNNIRIDEISIGQKLHASKPYLRETHEAFFETGTILTQILWRKIYPKSPEGADTSLINITYDLIHEKEYDLAKRLLKNILNNVTLFASENNKRVIIINLAQCYYHLDDKKSCHDLLSNYDWSICTNRFLVCISVLNDDHEQAAFLMKKIGNNSEEMKALDYLEWPIFKKFRETDIFTQTYKEVFGTDPISLEFSDKLNEEKTFYGIGFGNDEELEFYKASPKK